MLKKALLTLAVVLFLSNVAAAKTIVFASDATWPPMEMVDANKDIVGFCPDLVKAIAKAAGFTAVIKNTAWDGIFAGLSAGKYDAIASSVSITDKRKKAMDFSNPYFEVKQGVVTRKGAGIKRRSAPRSEPPGISLPRRSREPRPNRMTKSVWPSKT